MEKTYKVSYSFDGFGTCLIKASSLEEAEQKFYEGDFTDDKDDGSDYVFETAEEQDNA